MINPILHPCFTIVMVYPENAFPWSSEEVKSMNSGGKQRNCSGATLSMVKFTTVLKKHTGKKFNILKHNCGPPLTIVEVCETNER